MKIPLNYFIQNRYCRAVYKFPIEIQNIKTAIPSFQAKTLRKSTEPMSKSPASQSSPTFSTQFLGIFSQIVTTEIQLDTLRELLNEEIQFNLKDLYVIVAQNSQMISCKHIAKFLNDENIEINAIESLIKYYNQNFSLTLSFSQFSSIFLNRQNRLLTKMTIERDSMGTLPNYILNYAKKVLSNELKLHKKLDVFRKKWVKQSQALIQSLINDLDYLNPDKLLQYLISISEKCPEQIRVELQIFERYLKPFSKDQIHKKSLEALFAVQNCNAVTQYLKQQSKKKGRRGCSVKSQPKQQKDMLNSTFNDPFIRPQFHDCLSRPKVTEMFSYREIKSIQKHMNRLGQPNKEQIYDKIRHFETAIEKHCQKCLMSIKDILWLEKQIEYARTQLSLCPDFYPVLFFQCFHKDKQNRIIPSALDIYLKEFGINIPMSEIYLLFKRYAWHLEGKMDFNSFCSMFDVCETAFSRIEKNREIKSLADVDIGTKKNFLLLIATIIKNEKKIQMVKNKLLKSNINLRDVFACFDTDDDSYLSITDFRVVWKKYFNIQVSKDLIKLLWYRMGYSKETELIKYEEFIKEITPKSNFQQTKSKAKGANKIKKVKSEVNFTKSTKTTIKRPRRNILL